MIPDANCCPNVDDKVDEADENIVGTAVSLFFSFRFDASLNRTAATPPAPLSLPPVRRLSRLLIAVAVTTGSESESALGRID